MKNSNNFSFWKTFLAKGKKLMNFFFQLLQAFNQKYPKVSQVIQITFLFFFALVDLIYSILHNILMVGNLPEFLMPIAPYFSWILESPILQFWASPEKIFFLSYLVIELMVVRAILKFSKLIKYNILLIFTVVMLQGLVLNYWDLFFHREIGSAVMFANTDFAISFFLATFCLFFILYLYLYLIAIRGKFATIPGMNWLTDSVAFWLYIKTPTMKFGQALGSGNKEESKDEEQDEEEDENQDEEQDEEEIL